MRSTKGLTAKKLRILAFDTSLSCPGAAVVEVANGKATIIAKSHTKTDAKESYAVRGAQIEHWAHLFTRQHRKGGYDVIVRESYAGSFGHHSMFSAWAAVDRGLHYLNLEFTEKPIGQATIKKVVVGKGRAEKEEVEEAVRQLTGYTQEFETSDESDACAIALAYAIQNGFIQPLPKKEGKKTK